MAAGNDIHFSVPVERMDGFKAVIRESNAFAKEHDMKGVQPRRNGPVVDGLQPMIIRCMNRCDVLYCEVHGFIQDIANARPFQRTRKSAKYW